MNKRLQQPDQDSGLTPEGEKLLKGVRRGVVFAVIIALITSAFFTRQSWLPMFGANQSSTPEIATPVQPAGTGTSNAPQGEIGQKDSTATAEPTDAPGMVELPVPQNRPDAITYAGVSFPTYNNVIYNDLHHSTDYDLIFWPLGFVAPDNSFYIDDSETNQVIHAANGDFDVLATTSDILAKYPEMGKGGFIFDMSHGVDKFYVRKIGQTEGCKGRILSTDFSTLARVLDETGAVTQNPCTVATTGNSVSDFLGRVFFETTGKTTDDVIYDDSYGSSQEAVDATLAGKADAVICWEPECGDLANDPNYMLIVSTKKLSVIYDVMIISDNALETKFDMLVSFFADYFTGLKISVETPEVMANEIANWTFMGYETNHWTYVSKDNALEDFLIGFEGIAQASFEDNLLLIEHPELWTDNLEYERTVYEASGSVSGPFDAKSLINLSILEALKSRKDLIPAEDKEFVDPSFSFYPPKQTVTDIKGLQPIASFSCPNVQFGPDKTTIDTKSPAYAAFLECIKRLQQFTRQGEIYIQVIGNAPIPDPVHFGKDPIKTRDHSQDVAEGRADWISIELAKWLPNVTVFKDTAIGPITFDQKILEQKRFVEIILLTPPEN